MDTHAADAELSSILARSRSGDNAVRNAAIPDLGRNIHSSSVRRRLQEIMVDDAIVTMRVDAAEQLVRFGGENELLAVLTELGRRRNDPDIDYTAYMLSELAIFGEFPLLRNALAIDQSRLSPDARIGLSSLRELLKQMASRNVCPRSQIVHHVASDGAVHVQGLTKLAGPAAPGEIS
ncbi:hypothetical protein [Nocardia sp. NPDC004750]